MVADLPPPLPEELEACVEQASETYGIDELLIQAVIYRESSYDVDARVVKEDFQALGLMQINTKYWLEPIKEYGISQQDLTQKPCVNVAVGTWILRNFYMRYDNWHDTLAAYNAGHGIYIENGRGYSEDVLKSWRALYNQSGERYASSD